MRVDLRVKYDIEARKAAIELFERGHGSESAAKALSVPRDTVRQWPCVYRSFESEVLLSMDGKQAGYTYEQKVAAGWETPIWTIPGGTPRFPELDRRHVASVE